MTSRCEWCNGEMESTLSKCAGCSTLVRPFFGMLQNQIPSKSEMQRTNSILESSRGLSDTQRFLNLADEIGSEYDLPKAFRARRGRPYEWSDEDCESWRRLHRIIDKWGSVPVGYTLRLPGGGLLQIEDSKHFVDGYRLPNSLPLLDLAEWLSNPGRVGAICNWSDFLLAMSCSVREIRPMEDDGWGRWNVINSWPGVDAPALNLNTQAEWGRNTCPFMQFVGMRVTEGDERKRPHQTTGFIARSRRSAIQEVEGVASTAWMEILEIGDYEMGRLFDLRVAPRLAVIDNRLHLIALKDGRPGLVHVTVDPRVWRALVSWSLEPEGSPGARLMRDLFYTWNSDDEGLIPTRTQMKSAKLLRNSIEKLGERSSTAPIYYSDMSTGIHVVGSSGMHYLIIGTDEPSKFTVVSFPQKRHLADVGKHGLTVCIDPRIKLPAGDVAAAYLLALSNDVASRDHISTIDTLLDIFDGAPATPSLVDAWWKEVVVTYECIVEQEPDEDYEEEEEEMFEMFEEEERIPVEEPVPPPPPQPERYEVLFEMFEEAMGMGIGLHQNEDEAV